VASNVELTPQERRSAKKRVQQVLDELGVVSDLSDTSRRFVIDEVFSLVEDIETVNRMREEAVRRFAARAPEPAHLKKLRAKLRALETAAVAFYSEAERIERDGSEGTRRLANIDFATLDMLMDAIGALHVPYVSRSAAKPVRILWDRDTIVLELFEHFVNRCGLKPAPASQRIARIANRLWGESLNTTDPNSRTPNRSPAILKIVARARKRRTSR